MTRSQRIRLGRRSRGRPRNKLLIAMLVLASVAMLGGLSAVGYVASIAASAPPLDSLKPRNPGGFSIVYAADGQKLGVIQANQLRKAVPGWQIPQNLKDATVAIEDERFYSHKGVDYVGVVRAAVKNLESGRTVEGGSTITMQLIRNLYITRERTYQRKIREAKLAEEYENTHSKAQILTTYLNTVPFGTYGGQSAIGAWAAARMFFDKNVQDLTLPEAALLAGLPQAPSDYSPFRAESEAKRRRNEVLAAMERQGHITREEAQKARNAPLGVKVGSYFVKRRESFFFDYVKDKLYEAFPARTVRQGGLRVYTTLDLDMQRAARESVQNALAGVGPSGAVVTVDARNGHIRAMASSADYGKSKFNLPAQGHRQPGSTFKVMALMAALRRGVDPDATTYVSKPLDFVAPGYGPIKVKTYDNTYKGSINLTQATLSSDNSVYQQLALDVGPDAVKQTAYDMGIETKLDGYPGEALGGLTIGVSPLEMATANATIASGGVYRKPIAITKIRTADGDVLQGRDLPKELRPFSERRFQDGVTAEATRILRMNMERGTGQAAQIGCPAAGKTGTTSEHSDAWFVGYTPRLSTAVWVGYPQASIHMLSEYRGGPVAGATFPSEIWGAYMKRAKGRYCGDFPPPKKPVAFSKFFGKYANGGAPTGPYASPTPNPYGTTAPAVPPTTGGTQPNGTQGETDGGTTYDPDLYESQPQQEPPAPQGGGGAGAPAGGNDG